MAKIQRTRNAGTQTEAQYFAYLGGKLKQLHGWWRPMQMAMAKAQTGYIINPVTGRRNQGYECAHCKVLSAKKEVNADHINPVTPIKGWVNKGVHTDLNELADRLFLEDLSLYQILCKPCHSVKSKAENKERREWKKQQKEK